MHARTTSAAARSFQRANGRFISSTLSRESRPHNTNTTFFPHPCSLITSLPRTSTCSTNRHRRVSSAHFGGRTTAGRHFSSSAAGGSQYSWRGAAITCVAAAGLTAYLYYTIEKKRDQAQNRVMVDMETTGTPKLGGPFSLLNRQGKVFTDKDLRGKYALLYFGFVNCPDICPEEMSKQTMVIEKLDQKLGEVVTPVFITCDPKRDTVEAIDKYLKDFHPRMVGLTGTEDQIKEVTRSYRVYYNPSVHQEGEDYLVDHSIIHYLLDPRGKFMDFYGKNLTCEEMTQKMEKTLREDLKKNPADEGVGDVE